MKRFTGRIDRSRSLANTESTSARAPKLPIRLFAVMEAFQAGEELAAKDATEDFYG
jgi:hypothetical protein